MALRYVDGFETYASGDVGTVWTNAGGLVVSPGRIGGSCIQIQSNYINKTFDNQAVWIIGWAFRAAAVSSTQCYLIIGDDAGANNWTLALNTDNTFEITKGSHVAVTNGKSTATITYGRWYYLELKMTTSTSIPANGCQLNVDGVQWINVATGQNLQAGTHASCNQIYIGDFNGNQMKYYDDLYICDGTGSVNNTILGPQRVEARYPSTTGTNTAWTLGAGATTVAAVNNATPDGDTSYIYSNTPTQISTFSTPSLLDASSVIAGIQLRHVSSAGDATTRQVCDELYISPTAYAGTTVTLTNGSYKNFTHIWETDPSTTAAWTVANANTAQIGVKNIA